MTQPLPELPARPETMEQAYALIGELWGELQRLRHHAQSGVLESGVRLSESLLWRLQEEFFRNQGIAAWERVPYYITNNTFIAEAYADLIVAFLLDYCPHLDPAEPLYIVEMAAGTACFSFYLVKALAVKQQHHPELRALRVCYVVTDFTEKNIKWLETREQFAPYLARGQVDFAVFAPERDTTLEPRNAGRTLAAGTLANPIIAIGDYFFDSIRQDMFRTAGGQLLEGKYTFSRKPGSNGDTLAFEHLDYTVDYAEAPADYYADPLQNAILQRYAAELDKATVIFPVGALDCVRNLLILAGNQLVLLSSDKGHTGVSFLQEREDHAYQVHGSISFAVNYDAIQRYFKELGGQNLSTSSPNLSLVTVMSCLLPQPGIELGHCRYYFRETLAHANPINHLYYCQHLIEGGKDSPEMLLALISYLHLCHYDPIAFARCAEVLFKSLAHLTAASHADLGQVLDRLFDNYYPNLNQYNSSFWLGRVYFAFKQEGRASECFQRCVDLRPESPNAHYNLGLARQELKLLEPASESYLMYLTLAPDAEDADAVWQRVRELQQQIKASV